MDTTITKVAMTLLLALPFIAVGGAWFLSWRHQRWVDANMDELVKLKRQGKLW